MPDDDIILYTTLVVVCWLVCTSNRKTGSTKIIINARTIINFAQGFRTEIRVLYFRFAFAGGNHHQLFWINPRRGLIKKTHTHTQKKTWCSVWLFACFVCVFFYILFRCEHMLSVLYIFVCIWDHRTAAGLFSSTLFS